MKIFKRFKLKLKNNKIKWFFKGIRIRKWQRYILYQMIAGVICLPTFILLIINLWNLNFHIEIKNIVQCVQIGIGISVVISIAMVKGWLHLYNMQKLCQMSFNAVYYNLEGEEIEGKIVSSRKDMTYFPKIYYRLKDKKILISIKLDGSKFHKNFNEMTDTLAEMFDREVTSAKRMYWYMVYVLESIEPLRIHVGIEKINAKKNEIPLMKGLAWNFKKAPHALITGVTGGGKTYFLQYLINELKRKEAIVKIIDPKRSDLFKLRTVLGEQDVAYATGKVMQMFRQTIEEMEGRYKRMDKAPMGADYETIGEKPIFLIFDEFIAFIEGLTEAKNHQELMSYLTRIVLEGRQAGVFLVFATQRADAKYLSGAIRDNLGLRLSLGSLEKSGYRMTFGDVDRKFEKFESGHGYVWINSVTDTVREFYAPFLGMDYDPIEDLKRIMLNRTDSPSELRSSSSGSDKGEEVGVSEGGA